MKKSILLIAVIVFLGTSVKAQQSGNFFGKIGINYTFNKAEQCGFDINLGGYYSLNNYFYAGPKLSLTKLKAEKGILSIGPEVGTHLAMAVSKLAGDKESKINQNLSADFAYFLGFSLDANNDKSKAFVLNTSAFSLNIGSPKVLDNKLFVNYSFKEFYQIQSLKKLSALGLGTNLY